MRNTRLSDQQRPSSAKDWKQPREPLVIKLSSQQRLESFDLTPGRIIARKYEVVEKLGKGWEGEVYKFRELRTGIELAAKLFFPHRDPKDQAVVAYARKLYKLRNCSMVIKYHTEEFMQFRGEKITVLISEFVDGILLENFVQQFPGKRLPPYMALHVLYALSKGMHEIHALGEYHGDLHTENIVVVSAGLTFELKLLDMYYWGRPSRANIRDDIIFMIRLFYDILGGSKYYPRHPAIIKSICRGMKQSLILERFRNAGELKQYLETCEWLD